MRPISKINTNMKKTVQEISWHKQANYQLKRESETLSKSKWYKFPSFICSLNGLST